ncbi:hypothetical protein ACFYVL_33765 [Streptomyces sp. NPDC004111]|uniref:hypothetical protein n=1 Tax=Streptomyces sp. NPDC004111 TaxID=3364690 RepID=UPI003673741B
MTYRRAAIPALAGSVLFTLLLWWAGASAQTLRLGGTSHLLDAPSLTELARRLLPWSYDAPGELPGTPGSGDPGVGGAAYGDLYATGMQIRFVAVLALFLAGALLLIRRIPPTRGRTPATVLALWAWGPVAATLAVTVSAPWLIASQGRGSFRILPRLADTVASGGPVVVAAALVTALLTTLLARVTAKGERPAPRREVPPRAARRAATAGTAVVALSLVVLSYQPVAARIQTSFGGAGMLSEPGDLLRQWLLLGGWSAPSTGATGSWLLDRAADLLVLVVVWWTLRLLPGLLTRTTVPAMAAGAVCGIVLGLLASQVAHMVLDDTGAVWGPAHLLSGLGAGVPAALTFGVLAGPAALTVLRPARGGDTAAASR